MKKLFPVLLLLASLTLLHVPVKGTSAATILSDSGYLDSLGLYHVVGEVQNTGNVDVSVEVTAYFFNSENSAISTVSSPTIIDVLLAGRKGPFDIILCTSVDITVCRQQSAMVHSYSLGLTLTSYQGIFPLGLEIISYSNTSSPAGFLKISGLIRNSALGPALSVKVVATYYDSSGSVVAAAFSPSSPLDVPSGEQATFDIVLLERAQYVASYTLTAESAGYGLISKAPFSSVLTLVAPPATVGNQVLLTAYLRDENRVPISNALVSFQVQEEEWKSVGSSITDFTGEATVSYLPITTGVFRLKASYTGNPDQSPANDIALLTVQPHQPYPTNNPPVAHLAISPTTGDVTTTFTLDASSSIDEEELSTNLEVRWDWEGDGIWDTPWTTLKTAQHRYASPGTYTIRLEVRDAAGLVATAEERVVVGDSKGLASLVPRTLIPALVVLGIVVLIVSLSYVLVKRRSLKISSQ